MSYYFLTVGIGDRLRDLLRVEWSFGRGWWLIPGAVLGGTIWYGLFKAVLWLMG